jgi:hypothetical protein
VPAAGARDELAALWEYRSILIRETLRSYEGHPVERQFCGKCGTTVGWTLEFLPDYHGIAGGTFDAPTFWYRLERFFFARSKRDWLAIPQDMEVCKAMPG